MRNSPMNSVIQEDLRRIIESVQSGAFEGKHSLVSGGAGFLGSWIIDVLLLSGSTVTCVDNLTTGAYDNIRHLRHTKGFKFDKTDVCKYSGNPKVDVVFHLASRPAPDDYQKHPIETALSNSEGTHKMLELGRRRDARVFYASSSEVYGDPPEFPTSESCEGRVNPLGPRSCYDEGKRFGESLCKAYQDQYGLDIRVGRIFNSYGPRLRADGSYGRVISRFIQQAIVGASLTVFGDGSQTRSFCYVSDTVTAIMRFTAKNHPTYFCLNIGFPEETRIIDLANEIIRLTASNSSIQLLPFPSGDYKRRLPNVKAMTEEINWCPSIALAAGLSRTHRWAQDF